MSSGWDAKTYSQNFSFVPAYGRELIAILKPQKGEKILDLGCGTGSLTAEIAASGADVVGVDGDANMIALAQKTFPQLTFLCRDAHDLKLNQIFDGVFSNAALHWMKLPAVFPQVAKVLHTGGRFTAEMGGVGNIAAIEHAIYMALEKCGVDQSQIKKPWYFPTPAEAAQILERNHFEVRYMHLYDRPTHLPAETGGLKGWIKMFGRAFLEYLPAAKEEAFFLAVENAAKPILFREGEWYADYRRFHFVAIKKA